MPLPFGVRPCQGTPDSLRRLGWPLALFPDEANTCFPEHDLIVAFDMLLFKQISLEARTASPHLVLEVSPLLFLRHGLCNCVYLSSHPSSATPQPSLSSPTVKTGRAFTLRVVSGVSRLRTEGAGPLWCSVPGTVTTKVWRKSLPSMTVASVSAIGCITEPHSLGFIVFNCKMLSLLVFISCIGNTSGTLATLPLEKELITIKRQGNGLLFQRSRTFGAHLRVSSQPLLRWEHYDC